MRLRTFALLLLLVAAFIECPSFAQATPRFTVKEPTIIAFFVGGDQVSDSDADANEALSDFQLYFMQARSSLEKMGIHLLDSSAASFEVYAGSSHTTIRPKISVGYCFIAPNKKPRIEYGVHTDSELLEIAREYFAIR